MSPSGRVPFGKYLIAIATLWSLGTSVGLCQNNPTEPGPALKKITSFDPISCADIVNDYLGQSACLGDAGTYQFARLALSIESFADALQSAGLKSDSSNIQMEIYADIARFGVFPSLVLPATTLVDQTSMGNNPFGRKAGEINGRALISLEYLYPGIISDVGSTFVKVSSAAGTKHMPGIANFNQYMGNSHRSVSIDEFRMFGKVGIAPLPVQKLVIPSGKSLHNLNLLSDFVFSGSMPTHERVLPMGMALTAITVQAQVGTAAKVPTKSPHGILPENGVPFSGLGMAVVLPQKGDATALTDANFSLDSFRKIGEVPPRALQITDGISFLQSERSAARDPNWMLQPEGRSQQDGNAADSKSPGEPKSSTESTLKKVASQIARKGLGVIIGGYIGSKVAGDYRVAAIAILVNPEQLRCDKGEKNCAYKAKDDDTKKDESSKSESTTKKEEKKEPDKNKEKGKDKNAPKPATQPKSGGDSGKSELQDSYADGEQTKMLQPTTANGGGNAPKNCAVQSRGNCICPQVGTGATPCGCKVHSNGAVSGCEGGPLNSEISEGMWFIRNTAMNEPPAVYSWSKGDDRGNTTAPEGWQSHHIQIPDRITPQATPEFSIPAETRGGSNRPYPTLNQGVLPPSARPGGIQ